MNTTKKWLIIASIICGVLEIGWDIYSIVSWFRLDPTVRSSVFYLVFTFITIASSIAIIVLLIMAIWKNGKLFRIRYGYYMTALVIAIIVKLLSVSTILLVITMFVSDWVWIKPEKGKNVDLGNNVEIIDATKEEKIAKLKKLKEDGKISEQEYNEELMKLL